MKTQIWIAVMHYPVFNSSSVWDWNHCFAFDQIAVPASQYVDAIGRDRKTHPGCADCLVYRAAPSATLLAPRQRQVTIERR